MKHELVCASPSVFVALTDVSALSVRDLCTRPETVPAAQGHNSASSSVYLLADSIACNL